MSECNPVLVTIAHMLHAEACLELSVQIVCPDSSPKYQIYPIGPTHYLVDLWPNILLRPVIEILSNLELQYMAIEVFHYVPTKAKAPPSVLISTEDKTWNEAKMKILELCKFRGADLNVVIIETGISLALTSYNQPTPTGGIPTRVHSDKVSMGCSIGVKAEGGGTVGGYLKLRNPASNAQMIVGLTNYHMMRGREPWPATFDTDSHSSWQWPSGWEDVQCPARADHEAEIAQLDEDILRDTITFNTASFKLKVEYGNPTKFQRDAYDSTVQKIEKKKQRLDECKRKTPQDLSFGKIFASSGYKKAAEGASDRELDWALFAVREGRIGRNLLPPLSDLEAGFFFGGDTQVRGITTDPDPTGRMFLKIGRTTGLTTGRYSHIESHVVVTTPDGTKRTTNEKVIVHTTFPNLVKPFCSGGDSGAWIINESGELAGLLWGEHPTLGHCYFTTIDLVVADIERATKWRVEMFIQP